MKNLILIVFSILIYSCGPTASEVAASKPAPKKHLGYVGSFLPLNDGQYEIITIGDCEYIKGWVGSGNGGGYLCHKGDCSNPIHIYKNQ
jgi:hypothetical protein